VTQTRSIPAKGPYPRMTYEEYLRAEDIDEHTEWVDGEVIPMMSVSRAHAEIQIFLLELILPYLRGRPIGRVYLEPFNMKLEPDLPGRAPDILFLRNEHLDRVKDLFLDGPADLVVEIVSPGTESVDRGDKFLEYEKGGVPEYWILDPVREIAEFYVRDAAGLFRMRTVGPGDTFESTVIDGFGVSPDWLWSRHTPDAALRALGIIS
jgi:Uma2 family endonuclease